MCVLDDAQQRVPWWRRWVNVHQPEEAYRLHTDRTRPGTAIADSHRLHALRYFSHAESKSADQDLRAGGRDTQGLLPRRHVIAHVIAHIGKEANQLDQRESGELSSEAATDVLLDYRDPSVNTWRADPPPAERDPPQGNGCAHRPQRAPTPRHLRRALKPAQSDEGSST